MSILNTAFAVTAAFVISAGLGQAASHPANPDVGGAPMFVDKNIVENAVNSADHTTLVAAVKAADLVETLMTPGPFTVFAPTNAAFAALPAGTVRREGGRVLVGTATVPLELLRVQPAGKQAMSAADWARGLPSDRDPVFS